VAAFGASFLFARIIEGSLVGILDIGGAIQTGVGLAFRRCCSARALSSRWPTLPPRWSPAWLAWRLATSSFWRVSSPSTERLHLRRRRDDGAGNASGRFLGPLIILSAMTASIPIGIGSLVGALLFYIWQKPITGGAILGAMILGQSSRWRLVKSGRARRPLNRR
jgi:hypothetical protein